nr:hypothetical protein [Tanacetum cinerariifolium]
MDTLVDFSNFLINRLKVDTLTLELLAGPAYKLPKGSYKSLVELEYHLEEFYKATTDQLDWVNPKGQQYPHNLLKPLPLIPNNQGRRVIPFDHFINNDLAYLRGGTSSHKYTTSVTKTKATDYRHIKWIEDLVPMTMWIQEPIGYDKHALWGWHNYKHLDWITVRGDDDKLYKFKEGDFKRLRIKDIKDILLLLIQGKLTNLTVEECFPFNISLRMFTRSIGIQRHLEDLQLGVKSYQKKLNLTKDEESFDLIPQTPENSDDEGNGEEDLGLNVGGEEGHVEEDEKMNFTETSTLIKEGQSSSVSSQFVTSMLNPTLDSDRLRDEAQRDNDKFLKTVDENMKKIIKEQVKEKVKVQVSKILPRIELAVNEQLEAEVLTRSSHSSKTSYYDRLRDEAQRDNDKFLKTVDENMKKIIKEQVKEKVKVQVSKILPRIELAVNEQLEAEVLTRSSHSSKTSYVVAVDLSEMELKKILIEKIEGNKSIQRSDEQRNLYKALVDAYKSDKIILDTYEKTVTLKRRRDDDADKDEEPSVGPDRGSKRRREAKEPESESAPTKTATRSVGRSTHGSRSRQASASESALAKEPMQTTFQMEEPSHLEFDTCAEDQPIVQSSQHPEWFSQQQKPPSPDRDWDKTVPAIHRSIQPWISELAKRSGTRSSFNELMDTPLDFSNFLINRLKVDTLTPELLVGPTYELMKGSCKSLVELEYHLKEVFKARTDQLDWVNLEGQRYPHNLLKPLLLIPNNQGRRVIPFEHCINNDLEYLHGGTSSRKYTTSITKTKAADYGHINDGTLTDVRTALDDRLKGIRMQYLPQSIWRKSDKDRAVSMIPAIDKRLKTRRIMRSLEMFVGGRSIFTDLQVTPTKPGRMTKPYLSHRFIANCFNAGNLKMELSLAEQKSHNDLEAKQNKERVKENLMAEEIETLVEGTYNVGADEVDSSTLRQNDNQHDLDTRTRFMTRKKFHVLAQPLQEVMEESLPKMDDPHDDAHPDGENSAKRQKMFEHETYVFGELSFSQANESKSGPSTSVNQEQLDGFNFWTDSYVNDDDVIPTKKVSQELVEEMSQTVDEAKLCKKNPYENIFYFKRQKEQGKPKEEVYLNSKIVQVIKTNEELGNEHKFLTEIIARKANGSIVSITEPDYKNDIEDMYLLCINGKKVNLTASTITFLGIKKYKMFSIVFKPVYGIIYKNSKKERRVMRYQEIHKFYDATLKRVLEGLKSYNKDVKHGYVNPSHSPEDVEIQLFDEEIKEWLKHRDQMRQ